MNESLSCQSDKYCVFQCHGETFALPAMAIRSVTPRPELSSLPLSPQKLVGLAYVHKEFLPVFDLFEFVGSVTDKPAENQQMLVLNADEGAWAVLIDQVLGLESLEISFNGQRDDASDWARVNVGSASFQESFVSVLDSEDLFALVNRQLRAHWQELSEAADPQGSALETPAVG